jgi:hypothetical protein
LDVVEVRNCMGELLEINPGSTAPTRVEVPVGEAHVEVEVPPGCYVVQGHVCEPDRNINDFTDKAIVMAGCNQELCVDLIVPYVRTCASRDLHPFVREALRANLPENDIRIAARTILAAGRISPDEVVETINRDVLAAKAVKGAEYLTREYNATLRIIRK